MNHTAVASSSTELKIRKFVQKSLLLKFCMNFQEFHHKISEFSSLKRTSGNHQVQPPSKAGSCLFVCLIDVFDSRIFQEFWGFFYFGFGWKADWPLSMEDILNSQPCYVCQRKKGNLWLFIYLFLHIYLYVCM